MTQSTPPSPVVSSQPDASELSPSVGPLIGADISYDRFLDCVHCGLCTSACPTYLETGDENDSPRGRIYLMRAVTDGKLAPTDTVRRHLDLCLDCRSCETACPSGVQYGRLIEPFRVALQKADAGAGKAAAHGWFHRLILYGLFPYPRRMRWALLPVRLMQWLKLDRLIDAIGLPRLLPEKLRRMHALLPRLQPTGEKLSEVLPPIGKKRARVALFTGCVAEAMFSQTNRATARVLQANGCEVVVPPAQVCCGAIHYHSGAGEPALQLAEANASAFDVSDVDAVIVNVAGCGSMLKDYAHMAEELSPDDTDRQQWFSEFVDKVRDVSEFLAELGLRPPAGEIPLRAVYHDACHLCHAQQIRRQPRELLEMVPGLRLIPLAESEICCGAAGSYNLTEPDMADRLAERKLQNILAAESEAVITGNAGCTLQIQAALKRAGTGIRVYHPMEILDWSYQNRQPPT